MTTGFGIEAVDDLDALEGAFPAHVDRPVPAAVTRPAVANAAPALQRQDRAALDSAALSASLAQTLRTILPFVVADLIALTAAGLAAHFLVLKLDPSAHWVGQTAPFALFALVGAYWMSGLYSEIWVHPVLEFRQLTHVSTVGLLTAAAAGLLAPPLPLWCVIAWVGTVVLVPLFRTAARHLCVNRRWWGYPTLVIGSGGRAEDVTQLLLDAPRSGLRPVLVTDPGGDCRSSKLPVMNDVSTMESLVRAKGIRHAVVSLPDMSIGRMTDILDRFSGLVPHLLVLSDTSTLPTLWGASRSCGRLSGIEVRNGLLLATLQGVKRAIDLTVGFTALLLTLPLLLLIMAVQKVSSPGPIFYGQKRIGLHGRMFKAWKFRTMRTDSDAVLKELLRTDPVAREEWERDHKLRNDPRVTAFGRFLRKTSLDELPQIWNVFRGDMAIVGPRPIVESEVVRYGDVFDLYTTVKPGITGLWQVSGRSNVSYADRVLLDQFYIRHWSPWLDIYVLSKTVVALVNRDGAY